jgi:hypothetical protein
MSALANQELDKILVAEICSPPRVVAPGLYLSLGGGATGGVRSG